MGIQNFNLLFPKTKHGYGNINPKTCGIYVDGEFMRYRGYVSNNLTSDNAEVNCANTAFYRLEKVLTEIFDLFPNAIKTVVIYFDGKRPETKVIRQNAFNIDQKTERDLFKGFCSKKYEIKQLDTGESEKMMFFERNMENDANIFVTGDSDILSIAYSDKMLDETEPTFFEGQILANLDNTITVRNNPVKDSIMWYRVMENCALYGLDFICHEYGLKKLPMTVLIGMQQTDYTNGLFTKSMLASTCKVLTMEPKLVEEINKMDKIMDIMGAFYYVCVQSNFTFKKSNEVGGSCDYMDAVNTVNSYVSYIVNKIPEEFMVFTKCNCYTIGVIFLSALSGFRVLDFVKAKKYLSILPLDESIVRLNENIKYINVENVPCKRVKTVDALI